MSEVAPIRANIKLSSEHVVIPLATFEQLYTVFMQVKMGLYVPAQAGEDVDPGVGEKETTEEGGGEEAPQEEFLEPEGSTISEATAIRLALEADAAAAAAQSEDPGETPSDVVDLSNGDNGL